MRDNYFIDWGARLMPLKQWSGGPSKHTIAVRPRFADQVQDTVHSFNVIGQVHSGLCILSSDLRCALYLRVLIIVATVRYDLWVYDCLKI